MPEDLELREQIMLEAHSTPYSIHPGTIKMYKDLKDHFWWPRMKRDITKIVEKCLTCQKPQKGHDAI